MYQVGQWMTRDVLALGPEHRLYHAWDAMERHRFRHIPVLDRERKVLGVVSDRDLRRYVGARYGTAAETVEDRMMLLRPLGEVMSDVVVYVYEDDDLPQVLEKMLWYRVSSVLVVGRDDESLRGILTSVDLLRAMRSLMLGGGASVGSSMWKGTVRAGFFGEEGQEREFSLPHHPAAEERGVGESKRGQEERLNMAKKPGGTEEASL